MRKLVLFFLIFLFLLLGSSIIFFFFVPRTIIIERSQDFSIDNSNSASENHKKEPFYLKTISDIRDDFILEGKNFLEINLSKMKIKLYQDGRPIREVQILARGDPQGWGVSHRNI